MDDLSPNPPQQPPSLNPDPEETSEDDGALVSQFSPPKVLFGFFLAGFVLLVLFYFVLLWSLLNGNVANPLFEVLGMAPTKLKDTILLLTNGIFGLAALFLLLGSLIRVFQWFIVGKNAANRRSYFLKAFFMGGLFFVVAISWFWLVWLIEKTNVKANDDELNDSVIMTTPHLLTGLTAPVKVQFDVGTKLAERRITPAMIRQISWDLNGDGAVDASEPTVSYRYIDRGVDEGKFTATVKVDYFIPGVGERTFQGSRDVFITNEKIQGDIQATPERGSLPLKVLFSAAESLDPDGEVMLYEWDMDGNGEFEIRGEDEILQERTFTMQGDFPVRLRVTGRNNDTTIVEKVINVLLPEGNLRSQINAIEGFQGIAPFRVTLDGSQSFVQLGNIIKYEWFVEGEQKPVVGRTIQRTFYTPGNYSVSLIVENDLGEKHKDTQIIKVQDRRVSVNVNIATNPAPGPDGILTGVVPLSITFDASGSQITDPVEWRWDFNNDGQVDEYGPKVSHTFRKVGNYGVSLIILDAFGDAHEQSGIVSVQPAGVVARLQSVPLSGEVPLKIALDASGSTSDQGEIVTYVWELPGQAPIHYGANLEYEFKRVGRYPVKLTVVTDTGIQDTDEVIVSVRSKPIQASFSAFPAAGAAPLEVLFDPTDSTGTIVQYDWDFGDGTFSREVSPTHIYSIPGEYAVRLKIKDAKGIIAEMVETVLVTP